MNYPQTIQFLFSQLPMFHRIGKAAYKADLGNIVSLCNHLGNPQNKFKSVHIAGTNGKGSTSHMLASVFQENGLKTGLFTSPHLKDFRERIKINGNMIKKKEVVLFTEKMKSDINSIKPSFFEMTTALAFDYFAKNQVDIAIVEVGMGGRLDSTNIISPIVSVITNISSDHTRYLGKTIGEIAKEKAGIIKKGIPVVIGETQPVSKNVFIKEASEKKAPVFFADQGIGEHTYQTALMGIYQKKNIKTVLQAIQVIRDSGFSLNENKIRKGLLRVIENTGLMGRWQILSDNPLTICDVGHNKGGIKEVVKQISKIQYNNLHFVLGMVEDKNHDEILKLLPKNAIYYLCRPGIPRGLDAEELKIKTLKHKLRAKVFSSVSIAFKTAQKNAEKDDLIFIGGSTFVVAEII